MKAFGRQTCSIRKKSVSLLLAALLLFSIFTVALSTVGMLRAQAADDYLYIPVSLYDYKYDNQINTPGAAPDAGTRSGGYPNKTPYNQFNTAISNSGYTAPLYFGDFYPDSGNWSQTPWGLSNFYWGANIANQSATNAAAQGLVDDTLTDGKLTQNGKELPYFSKDWFNLNRSTGTNAVNTISFEFYSNGSWWQDTADSAKRTFIQGNTYTYTIHNNQSRTFTQTEKGDSTRGTTFIVNLDASTGWASKPEKVRLNITSASGETTTEEVNITVNGAQRRATFVLENDSIYAAQGQSYADIYENIEFPFYQTVDNGVTYYEFDSEQRNLYFDGSTFTYTDNAVYDTMMNMSQCKPGFFPFNNGNPSDKGKLDYGFGAKFEIPFSMTRDGKINGQDIVFEFTGDDDVWVFIDGKLVLDMGGAHAKSNGSINFSTQKATVTTGAFDGKTTNQSSATSASVFDFSELIDFSNPTQTHTLTMFYMERGMWESNMKLRFNFPQTNTFTIDNRTSFEGVNSALLKDTMKEADNDVVAYNFQNQGSTQAGDSGLYPSAYDVTRTVEGQRTLLYQGTGAEPVPTTGYTIYLNAQSAGWTTPYVWAWDTGEAGQDHQMAYDSESGYYFYNFPAEPENLLFKNGAGWGGITKTADLIPAGQNLFTLHAAGTSGSWSMYGTGGAQPQNGDNFVPDGNNWTEVGSQVLTEKYDVHASPKTYVSSGQTLFYGQTATYLNQFTRESLLQLRQEDILQRPTRVQGQAVILNQSHKTLSEYYDTVWVLSDVDENVLGVGESNTYVADNLLAAGRTDTFAYSNLDTEDIVRSTAQKVVFQNTVKTGDIIFKKELTQAAAALGANTEFSFQVQIHSLFGGTDHTWKTYPVNYTVDGVAYTASSDGIIKLKAGQTATISGVPVGTVYKVTEVNIPEGFEIGSVGGDSAKTVLAGTVTQDAMTAAQGTFVNDLSSAQITISKRINELYYGPDDNPAGLAEDVNIADTDIPGDTHGYENYTGAEQSFVFTVEQFAERMCTGEPEKTFFVVISFDKSDGENLVKSETIDVTPGKYYKITEDTQLAWKYDLYGISVSNDGTGNSYKDQNAAYLYATTQNPVAEFENRKTQTKNNIEGDTALVVNRLSPAEM